MIYVRLLSGKITLNVFSLVGFFWRNISFIHDIYFEEKM
jgi:hypothetical protein